MPSSTGAPEGDAVSVLGMIAVGVVFCAMVQAGATPRTYVDNWGWTVRHCSQHRVVVRHLQRLEAAMRLVVDWSKAYVFATCPQARKWLKQHSQSLFPTAVPLVTCVKELGTHLQFSKRHALGSLPTRFKEATRRLHRLFHSPASLASKALVVQNSIWPFAMFGSHGQEWELSVSRNSGPTPPGLYMAGITPWLPSQPSSLQLWSTRRHTT